MGDIDTAYSGRTFDNIDVWSNSCVFPAVLAARAQVYLRAGWSLGLQKRYIYEGNGSDRQCGRAATGLTVDAVRVPHRFSYVNRPANIVNRPANIVNRPGNIVLRRRSSVAYRHTLTQGRAQRLQTRNGSRFCPDLFITQSRLGPQYRSYWPPCSITTSTFINISIRSTRR